METGVTGLPTSGADSACVPASGSHASRDWLSRLKQVVAENKRLDKLDTEKGKKETNGFRIGTRLVRKDASGNNVFGMVVQVVSKSDEANQYEYPWVWAAWMDGELTAPGNDKTELHNMRKNFNQLKASAPDFPRKLFIEKWYAHFRHGIRALVQPGAHSSILGLRVSHLEHGRPSMSTQQRSLSPIDSYVHLRRVGYSEHRGSTCQLGCLHLRPLD